MENLMILVFVCLIIFAESHLEHHALEDSLVRHLTRLVVAQVEEGDGGAVWISAGQDSELAETELCLEGTGAVVKVSQPFPYPGMNVK